MISDRMVTADGRAGRRKERPDMTMTSITYLMISVFMLIPLMLGEFARNRTGRNLEDFLLQSRRMGFFPMWSTVFATWMSAFAYIGAISYFKERGAVYMTTVGWDAFFAVLFFFVGRRIWFYGRNHGYTTASDFFRDIYGSKRLTFIVTAISIVFTLLYIDIQMMGGLLLIQTATGGRISWQVSAIVFFVVLIVYLWAGGLRAVAMTDIFYGLLIVVTIMASGVVLIHIAGGAEAVFSHLIAHRPEDVSLLGGRQELDMTIWVCMFITLPIGLFMGPQFWIRNYAAGRREHFDALPFAVVLSSVVFIGTMLAGSAVIVLKSGEPADDALLAGTLIEYTSPIFAAFIFMGIAAAIFSTANSLIHAIAAVCTVDVYRRFFPNATEHRLLMVARWSVVGASGMAFLLLLVIPHTIFDTALFGCTGTAQLFIPVVGALAWDRSSPRGAAGGIVTGLSSFFIMMALSSAEVSVCAVVSLLINAIVFVTWSCVEPAGKETADKIRAYRREFDVFEGSGMPDEINERLRRTPKVNER